MSVGNLADAVRLIEEGDRFLVACHRRPDADALGSAMGFVEILRALDKEAVLYVPDTIAQNLRFLGAEPITSFPKDERFDSTWVMDTAAEALLPEGLELHRSGPLVIVDHHAAHDDVGDVILRDVDACSTAEVVMELAGALGVRPVPHAAAQPLYAALVADTGGFRYSGTTAHTLRLGAELLDRGAEPWRTAYELFEGWPKARMHLLGAVLDTLELHFDGKLAFLLVTREMLKDFGANDDMVEGLVDYGRKLRGVEVALLLWEFPGTDGEIDFKISLRSAGRVDVSKVAIALGGGGHASAAGAQIRESLNDLKPRALTLIENALIEDA